MASAHCAEFRLKAIVAVLATCIGGVLTFGQGVEMEPVPSAQAQAMLKAIIPPKKKFVSINAYIAGRNVKDVNLGMHCSSSSSGRTSGTVDDSGNIDARTQMNGSSSCTEQHKYYNTLYLGFEDLADPQYAYLVTTECVATWVWDHCEMPPEKSIYPVVIEMGKHGAFSVYVGVTNKLGGKVKVAKFAVLDITHAKAKNENQSAPKADEK